MSRILEKSPKHCAQKGLNLKSINKKLLYSIAATCTTILLFILLIYLILHPTKPEFTLREAYIEQLDLSGTRLLNSSIQVALDLKNPNQKVGIFYDELQVYASYKGQQITVHTPIPAFYQGNQDENLLSAALVGTRLPMAPSFAYEVVRDQTAGQLLITFKVDGMLRWKVGTWVSGRYPLNVNCVATMPMTHGPANPTRSPISAGQGSQCSTTI